MAGAGRGGGDRMWPARGWALDLGAVQGWGRRCLPARFFAGHGCNLQASVGDGVGAMGVGAAALEVGGVGSWAELTARV